MKPTKYSLKKGVREEIRELREYNREFLTCQDTLYISIELLQ
jgi:hypothetical protein